MNDNTAGMISIQVAFIVRFGGGEGSIASSLRMSYVIGDKGGDSTHRVQWTVIVGITCKLIALTVHIERLIHLSGLLLIYAWMHGAARTRHGV